MEASTVSRDRKDRRKRQRDRLKHDVAHLKSGAGKDRRVLEQAREALEEIVTATNEYAVAEPNLEATGIWVEANAALLAARERARLASAAIAARLRAGDAPQPVRPHG